MTGRSMSYGERPGRRCGKGFNFPTSTRRRYDLRARRVQSESSLGLGRGGWSEGHNEFRPTPPPGVHKLKWTWLNTTVEIPLR